MMKYKAIICDVDGTLIASKDGIPSKRVTDAIHSAQKNGIQVCLATARGMFELKKIIKILNLSSPSIVTGGALIVDPMTGKVLKEKLISKEDVNKVFKISKRLKIPLLVEDNNKSLSFDSIYIYNKPVNIYSDSIKISLGKKFLNEISKIPSLYAHKATSYTAGEIYALVNSNLASKQEGVSEIAELLGILPKEIIGVGDGSNDLPLLMACGLKVAMGNADKDLKAIADYIAPSVENDGVADVIEKFLINK